MFFNYSLHCVIPDYYQYTQAALLSQTFLIIRFIKLLSYNLFADPKTILCDPLLGPVPMFVNQCSIEYYLL